MEVRESWKRGFKWDIQEAIVPKGRGRARGGILIGVKEEIEVGKKRKWDIEGWVEREVKLGEEWWWLVGAYINEDLERKKKLMSRKSKDKVINKEGKELCRFIEERGWAILNGCIEGDEDGEWTFVGERGCSVIDVVMSDERNSDKILELKVEDRTESDHLPVSVKVIAKGSRKDKKDRETRQGTGTRVRGNSGWWDEECRKEKSKLGKALRKSKSGKMIREDYIKEKKQNRKVCERKKEQEKQKWEDQVKNARSEEQIWKIVNEGRKKRDGINKDIKMETWDEHFKETFGGVEERRSWEGLTEEETEEEGELGDIELEEVREVVKKLKDYKALGGDGIPNEVWRYGGEKIEAELWSICQKVWRREGWPNEWNDGIVVPIKKKRLGKEASDYRSITITQTAYKVYVGILEKRLREEVEGKGRLPIFQAGFRKKSGTIDNIYALNYLINREIHKEKGKLVVLFVDFKAAFDSVDRTELVEGMIKRGVNIGLVKRCEEVLKETNGRVRVGKDLGEKFWTVKGVRQGCPLSPLL
ncbi:GSCOCG00011532001-RA-CDS, partial [Cotesia congregata]